MRLPSVNCRNSFERAPSCFLLYSRLVGSIEKSGQRRWRLLAKRVGRGVRRWLKEEERRTHIIVTSPWSLGWLILLPSEDGISDECPRNKEVRHEPTGEFKKPSASCRRLSEPSRKLSPPGASGKLGPPKIGGEVCLGAYWAVRTI